MANSQMQVAGVNDTWRMAESGALLLAFCFLALPLSAGPADATGFDFFEKNIRPVLIERCYECHSAQAKELKGGLRLDSRSDLLKGGSTGAAIIPGKPEQSLLLKIIRGDEEQSETLPQHRLSSDQVGAFAEWIKLGAPDPRDGQPAAPAAALQAARQFWSFQPVRRPKIPRVRDAAWPAAPIDFFILAELEKRGLKPNPAAGRSTLIRRATFDLIGLPPSPEEAASFLADPSPLPEAFAKVVDRLLASPHYGERWGRHWMDLVRYADTAGDNSDFPIPEIYRFRNYVIEAFNQDKPYDQFIREQIAGDLLPAANQAERNKLIIATGYVALSRRFGSIVTPYPQHLTIEDTIDNLGRAFLGLTISCARCHDHKYDAISMKDYYGLYGIFQSTQYPFPGIELEQRPRDFVPLLEPEKYEALMAPYRRRIAEIDQQLLKLKEEKKTAEKEKQPERAAALNRAIKETEAARAQAEKEKPKVDLAYAVSEGKAAHSKIQKRGEPKSLGDEVPRKFLDRLGGQEIPPGELASSGRRQLGEWLSSPENPLTARVMVNRIWQYHFGSGLVKTPSDFGVRGQPPSHPELLDWLADRFVAEGWSMKKIHRRILLSRVYQLSSAEDERNLARDGENRFHWRFHRRRLDAEQLHDSIRRIAGTLDLCPLDQPHPFPPVEKWDFTQHHPFKDVYPTNRRSVYSMQKRLTALPYFQTFDGPDPNAITSNRDQSVTTVQALFLLNNDFIHEQSRKFAERLLRESGDEPSRLERAFMLALGRPPTRQEREESADFLRQVREKAGPLTGLEQEKRAWTRFAAVLFRINEFLYLD